MDYRYAINGEFFMELRGDFLDFGHRHGFVGFVLEVKGAAIF